MNWDSILGLLILAFLVWEVIARYVFHNRQIHTLSNLIGKMEARYPRTRVLVAVVLVVLALHLTVHWI
jgi:hypothetical protein